MKKLLVLLLLMLSIVCSSVAMPIASAEINAQNETTSTYIPPNMKGEVTTEENTGDFNIVPVNNNVLYPLSGGTWSRFIVSDLNQDGYLDFQVSGNGIGDNGIWNFYGTPESQNPESKDYLVMEGRRRVSNNNYIASTPRCIYDDNGNYVKTTLVDRTYIQYDANVGNYVNIDLSHVYNPLYINGDKITEGRTTENNATDLASGAIFRVVDINGDGVDDYVYTLNEWGSDLTEHGNFKIPLFSNDGFWGDNNGDGVLDERDPDADTNGDGKIDANDIQVGDGDDDPMHGHVLYLINQGTNTQPIYPSTPIVLEVWDYEVDSNGNKVKVEGTNTALDVYGEPSPVFEDFDNDGDLDLICSSTVGIITYYENIGSSTNPIFIKGQRLKSKDGRDIMAALSQDEIHNCDWNNDGFMDIILNVAADEGRLYLIENTGVLREDGMPIFTQPRSFMCPADSLKINGCSRPTSVDWDGDGDEDLIVSDSGGFISFVKNLTIEKALEINPNKKIEEIDLSNPIWDSPVYLKTPDDKTFVVKAGYKGNHIQDSENFCGPQGPSELNVGYVVATVADWDLDGTLDIIYNDVYGRIRCLKGIEGDYYHVNYPETLKVEWVNGEKRPTWYDWWQSEEGDLVTIWRTTPNVIDLPLDEDGDGVAEGDGLNDLILIDHEGYFAFYQRYRDRDGTLKLKEGKRIFKLNDGNWQPTSLTVDHGKFGWRIGDWDGDGDLDILTIGSWSTGNVYFYENISTTAGEYNFVNRGDVHTRITKRHEVDLTFCDWNKDGMLDMLSIGECGNVYYLINNSHTQSSYYQ